MGREDSQEPSRESTVKAFFLAPLSSLPAVSRSRQSLFERLLGQRVGEVLFHFPQSFDRYERVPSLSQARCEQKIILMVTVEGYQWKKGALRTPHRIICRDSQGNPLILLYFHGAIPYLSSLYPLGSHRVVWGKINRSKTVPQITHPLRTLRPESPLPQESDVLYPLTTGITQSCVKRLFLPLLNQARQISDWMPEAWRKSQGWPEWFEALWTVHHPEKETDLTLESKARQRLCFDELFTYQLALLRARRLSQSALRGPIHEAPESLTLSLKHSLPFSFTASQDSVIQEIFTDMAQTKPMCRLVQGDVGCGKTIVALMAMVRSVECGYQAALLAPTDLLAQQHGRTLQELLCPLSLKVGLLTGRQKGKAKTQLLKVLRSGELPLLVGTHALIQEGVEFHRLGLAVVDEQHRFGVDQRLALQNKGQRDDASPHLLLLSATPIPRTLQLTQYGDMDISLIHQKPEGRQRPITKVLPLERLEDVVEAVARALDQGTKIFWVCPLVKESETSDLCAVEARFSFLTSRFGKRVGSIHGQMNQEDRDRAMAQFADETDKGGVDLLVATTVIEVGVHIPQATIMIIEHAERFGLAQLHQLRGRIGRGNTGGTCLLLYSQPITPIGRARLDILRQSDDGFEIAEKDLFLRGSGDLLGTRQSGLPSFRTGSFADEPERMETLLSLAADQARLFYAQDPELKTPQGQRLSWLLSLFQWDQQKGPSP